MSSSVHARKTRMAISPRLATITLRKVTRLTRSLHDTSLVRYVSSDSRQCLPAPRPPRRRSRPDFVAGTYGRCPPRSACRAKLASLEWKSTGNVEVIVLKSGPRREPGREGVSLHGFGMDSHVRKHRGRGRGQSLERATGGPGRSGGRRGARPARRFSRPVAVAGGSAGAQALAPAAGRPAGAGRGRGRRRRKGRQRGFVGPASGRPPRDHYGARRPGV